MSPGSEIGIDVAEKSWKVLQRDGWLISEVCVPHLLFEHGPPEKCLRPHTHALAFLLVVGQHVVVVR